MLTFEVTGKSTSTNTTEYVNIELISTGSADDIDLGRVEVKKSKTTTVRTDDVEQDALYYVLVTPDTQSAGHAIHANVTISN